jgi:YidC/Oxa1 family membrane protein insertase
MDRKSIIAIVVGLVLLFGWSRLINHLYPPRPLPPRDTNALASATNQIPSNAAPIAAAPAPSASAATTNVAPATPSAPEETVELESADARYIFTSHGGGLKEVVLKNYKESVRRGASVSDGLVTINEHGRAAILSMQGEGMADDNVFTLTRTPTNTVIAERQFPSGLRLVKIFSPGTNYTVQAHVWYQNNGDNALAVPAHSISIGTAAPAAPEEQPALSGVFWYSGEKATHIESTWFDNRTMGCFPGTPRAEYDSGTNAVQWAAVHNQFFALAVIPATNNVAGQFKATRGQAPGHETNKNAGHTFTASIGYPAMNVAAKQFVDRQFTIYAGPKQEKTLTQLGRHVDEVMDFGFWSPISKIFLRTMNQLHKFMPYGVALILITVVIKMLFWPLTQASTRSMKRMQALQPEIKKLQEKYKDDPAKQQKKMMELWREHKVNPMSGCWPMMIQLPIFFALFRMIPNAIELRGTPFLWIADLSRPDTIFYLPSIGWPFNPLPLVMGVTMLWQARLTPPSPGMDPAQQKIMKYMPLMFMFFLYNQPAGLTLYWTVQNLLTILQTKLTKAKEAGAVVTPAAVTPRNKLKK